MVYSPRRVMNTVLLMAPVLVLALWVIAPWYAGRAQKQRAYDAFVSCRRLAIAAIEYATDHGDRYPPAVGWEQVLRPYLERPVRLPRTLDGKQRRFAINSAVAGREMQSIPRPASTLLFFETEGSSPAATVDALPPEDSLSGFALGWSDGHVYYREAAARPYLIKETNDALKPLFSAENSRGQRSPRDPGT